MSVKINAAGWTEVIPEGDDRQIHVSTSGSDAYSGTSPDTAFRTTAKGLSMVRDGHGDQLLFRGGDVFPEPLGRVIKSGESKDRPLLIGSYGGGRAKFPGGIINFGGGAPSKMWHVVYQSLVFEGHGTGVGVEFLRPIEDVLFEDVRVAGFSSNMVLNGADGPLGPDLRMRRCQVLDAWTTGSEHANGLFVMNAEGFSAFECLFDHNGYNSPTANTGANQFRHNIYVHEQNNGTSLLEGCVSSRASSHGAQLRRGGTIKACIFTDNSIGFVIGAGAAGNSQGVPAVVQGTLILNGKDISPAMPRGWAMNFSNINGGRITGNLVAHNNGGQPSGIDLDGDGGSFGIENFTYRGNVIHDWGAGVQTHGAAGRLRNVIDGGQNSIEQPASIYVDPTKNIPAGYITTLRGMSKANWDKKLWPLGGINRGIMAGYALK